jgi:uncharacterized protein (TIGR02147 family)
MNENRQSLPSTGNEPDYRAFLEQTLRSRKARNASYSLRSFARDIGLSPSRLTEIFQRKDGLSAKKAATVAGKLGLTPHETEEFLAMVESQSGRSPVTRRIARAKLAAMQGAQATTILRNDCIALLQGWQHFALLELARTPEFRSSPAWIGRRLGLSDDEAKACISRLVRVGLFEKDGRRLRVSGTRFATTSDIPSSAIRDYHAAILQYAGQAIDRQNVHEREYAAAFFPVEISRLPALKEDLREARRGIIRKYEYRPPDSASSETAAVTETEIYCLANQLFRVSVPEDTSEKTRH